MAFGYGEGRVTLSSSSSLLIAMSTGAIFSIEELSHIPHDGSIETVLVYGARPIAVFGGSNGIL